MAAMGSPEAIKTGRKFARLVHSGCQQSLPYRPINNNRAAFLGRDERDKTTASTQAAASKLTGPRSRSGEQGVRKTSAY